MFKISKVGQGFNWNLTMTKSKLLIQLYKINIIDPRRWLALIVSVSQFLAWGPLFESLHIGFSNTILYIVSCCWIKNLGFEPLTIRLNSNLSI